MTVPEKKKHLVFLWFSTLAYCLIGVEIIIMISPFALYFYSIYGPVLEFLFSSTYLSWTTEFFLPHMVFLDDPIILAISYLQILFVVGLVLFIAAAVPLYYGRFTGRGVVQISFYSKIRHPQYLFLAISGFGLLLYWPRFIILIMYVTMLFVYYLLAKNEEWRMKQEAPDAYIKYMDNTPMFIPGEPGRKIFHFFLAWLKPKWLGILTAYCLTLLLAVGTAYGFRSYVVKQLPTVSINSMSLLSVFPRPAEEIIDLYSIVKNSEKVQSILQEDLKPNLTYVFPGDFFLTAIITDQDRRWFPDDDITARIPEIFEWHQHKFKGGLAKFFRIFYNFFSTLGTLETDYAVERLVLVEVSDENGNPAVQQDLFNAGLKRSPVLIVDIDHESHQVISVLKTTGANKWGHMPMPTF